jgi:hypothetical protein
MHEAIDECKDEDNHIADGMGPRRPLCADLAAGEEIHRPGDSRENAEDKAGKQQPFGEMLPHEVRRPPIRDVSQERERKAGDRKRNQHRMDGMSGHRGG